MSDYFPVEILVEILHRIPAKSLVKCTGVCKSWRSLITDPTFILDHLRRTIDDDHEFLLIQLCNEGVYTNRWRAPMRYSLRFDYDQLDEFSTLDLPLDSNIEFSVIGICNGLVCITSSRECYSLCICNPSIRRYVSLPKPSDYCGFNYHETCVGFGFDSRTDDYKVIRIVSMMDDTSYGVSPPEVELYSLATGFWKNITSVAPVCSMSFTGGEAPHACIDGILHWGAKRRINDCWYHFILSFDFGEEVFGEIKLPHNLANASSHTITVIGGGKSLALYQETNWPCVSHIWVMKEYGDEGSWNKVFTFNLMGFYLEVPFWGKMLPEITSIPTAVCYRKSGEVLLLMSKEGEGCLYSLDIERKNLTDLRIGGRGYKWYMYSGYYAESLVLLNKANGLVSY
ncbi:hypothetical protein L6164_007344 [Bauhinia variegata]|uniref:Uncharacterized protein n=1 Tax=Bauhinia variegata TaxID=167791 RepID=A0ACB9PEP9_BAUVA|nr:hypothetical protein L6164_007344 [Bauhinia variegata]